MLGKKINKTYRCERFLELLITNRKKHKPNHGAI